MVKHYSHYRGPQQKIDREVNTHVFGGMCAFFAGKGNDKPNFTCLNITIEPLVL
jgi:hypothetical protein